MRMAWDRATVPCTTNGDTTFGSTCLSATTQRGAPRARMASTYSFSRSARTGPRITRAKRGTYTIAMAITALLIPGPRMAAMPTDSSSPGMLKKTSSTRLIRLSQPPPR